MAKDKSKTKSKGSKKEKKSKKSKTKESKTKDTKKVVEETPAPVVEETKTVEETPAPVVEETKVVEEVVKTVEKPVTPTLDEKFKSIIDTLVERINADRKLLSQVRDLQKEVNKERKALLKSSRKKTKDPNKVHKPSGFAKPTQITPELCKFLGVDEGTLMARTDVTKAITKYIKDNNLQNPEFKKQILPDKKLKKLLNSKDEEVTYFNLQRFMKVHYIKASA